MARLLPGGYATLILSELGAEVIKIEGGEGEGSRYIPPFINSESHHHLTINRNKKSVAIDLKSEEGLEIFLHLSENSDCILENFRPGVTARLGIHYEKIQKRNEKIIYCALSGFGQESPYNQLPAFDLNLLAMSGILQLSQKLESGKPSLPGILLADTSASLWTVIAILMGLQERERTGKGRYIDLSMFDGLVSLLTILAGRYFADGDQYPSAAFVGQSAAWNVYETKDGKYVCLAAYDPKFWKRFCESIDREDLIPFDFHNNEKREEVIRTIEGVFRTKTRDDWEIFLQKENIPLSPVKGIEELIQDPHVTFKNLVQTIQTKDDSLFNYVRTPFYFPDKEKQSAPQLGEHTREILLQLGYGQNEVERLIEQKVIKG